MHGIKNVIITLVTTDLGLEMLALRPANWMPLYTCQPLNDGVVLWLQVIRAINRCCRFTLAEITPLVVAGAVRKVQYSGNSPLTWHSRLRLLRYFLHKGKYDLLDGLELLPLANGGFTEVTG